MAGGEDEDGRAVNKPIFPPYPEGPPIHHSMYTEARNARVPGTYTENPPPPALIERSDPPASMADEPVSLPPGDSDENYSDQMSEVLAKVGEEEVAKTSPTGDSGSRKNLSLTENLSTDPNMPVYMKRKRGRPRKHPLPAQRRPEGSGRRAGRPKSASRVLPRKIKKEPVDEPMLVEQMLEDELADRLPTEQSLALEEDSEENAIRFTDVGNHLPLLISGQHLCAVCLSRHSHRQSSGMRRTRSTSFKRFTSVICRTCNKFLCVAPRADGRTCFDIYHTLKDFIRSDLPEFNRKECGDSDIISSEFDDSPDLTEDANMLLQLLQVASGEINKVSDLDDEEHKNPLESSIESVFPETSESQDTETGATQNTLSDTTLSDTPGHKNRGSTVDKGGTLDNALSESLTGAAKSDTKDGQSQAISLLLKVLNQYGNAPVMLRHLLARWQDKLVLIGQHVNPKPRSPSPKRRRSRKNKPKRCEVTEDAAFSDEDNDADVNNAADSGAKSEDPARPVGAKKSGKKRGRPRLTGSRLRLKNKRYQCTQCEAAFSIPSRLKDHYRVHTGERPFPCDKCDMKFMRAMHLKKHRTTHSGLRPFKCMVCNKSFLNNASLKMHTYTHTGERPHQCHCCPQSFTRSITLQEHMRQHTGEKPYDCKECDLKFAKKAQLKAHMLYHTGEKPYLCQTCGTRFRHNTAFTEHVRIHTGIKPFVCQHCGTAFRCKSTLKKHVRLHTGEKPYTCSVCDMGFAQRTSLVCHMKKHPGMTLPTQNAVKPSTKAKGGDVCLYPVVGRKKRPVQGRHLQLQQQERPDLPGPNHTQSSTVTMATLTSPVDHLLSVSGHLEHVRNQENSESNGGMTNSHSNHAHTSSDHAHLRVPDPGSHFPNWSHDLPSQVAGFQYDQATASIHRAHQVTSQPFPGFLPMSSQMPPTFPNQQRFPLDYRFSMN